MNQSDQAVFDPLTIYKRPPTAKTKRECTLEVLITQALPHLIEKELSTKTSPKLRALIADITEEL